MKRIRNCMSKIANLIVRYLLSIILFILPVKAICMYLEISLSILFVKIRSDKEEVDLVRFFKLVNNDYSDNMIELPNCTLQVIWSENLLNREYEFETGKFTLLEIMRDRCLLGKHIERVVDIMLLSMPFLMKLKLGMGSELKRSYLRKEVVDYLHRKFSYQIA